MAGPIRNESLRQFKDNGRPFVYHWAEQAGPDRF